MYFIMVNDMTQDNNYQYPIPATVMADKKLSPTSKLVYGIIAALSQKEGHCWASSKFIAKQCGYSRVSVSRRISELADAGYIKVEIADRTKRKILVSIPIHPCINSDTPLYQNCNKTCINSDTENIKEIENKNTTRFTPEGVLIE